MEPTRKPPLLVDEFGVPFYGEAKTITGDIWWYEQDGKRYALVPEEPKAKGSNDIQEKP